MDIISKITDKFSPPTDNLYKFLALLGIIVFLASWILPLLSIQQTEEELNIIEPQVYKYAERVDIWINDSESLQNDPTASEQAKDENEKTLKELKIEGAELQGKMQQIYRLKNKIENLKSFSLLGQIISCIFIFGGGYMWYKKTQAPIDKILQNESESKQLSQNKANQNNSRKNKPEITNSKKKL